jgi:hypothetical protein
VETACSADRSAKNTKGAAMGHAFFVFTLYIQNSIFTTLIWTFPKLYIPVVLNEISRIMSFLPIDKIFELSDSQPLTGL